MKESIRLAQDPFIRQRGVVAVFLAIGMLSLIGVAGLALDMGHAYLNRGRLQNALDAAALSGAYTLHGSASNAALAIEHATDTFNDHLVGEMQADTMTLNIELSPTLVPFAPGGANPQYVRVSVDDYNRPYFLASVLPGVGTQKTIGASAVAGAIPLNGAGSEVCDIAPLLICGDETDTNPDDETLFGIKYDDGTGTAGKYCLKSSASSGGNGNGGNGGNGNPPGVPWPDDCANEDLHEYNVDNSVGPGNFQLIQLSCGPGGNCVRENLAGGYDSCLTDTSSVTTKPGNTVGPTAQGFNTRFGIYQGGMSRADYPPDLVTTQDIPYNEYLQRYADKAYNEADGAPFRRVMAVPIGNCGADSVGAGQTDVPVLALGCFYMSEQTENKGQANWIKGYLVRDCQASGKPGDTPDSGPFEDGGPEKIILYKDPDSRTS